MIATLRSDETLFADDEGAMVLSGVNDSLLIHSIGSIGYDSDARCAVVSVSILLSGQELCAQGFAIFANRFIRNLWCIPILGFDGESFGKGHAGVSERA